MPLQHHLIQLNETTEDVTLHLKLNTVSNMYWTFIMAFQQSFEMQKGNGLMGVCYSLLQLSTVFSAHTLRVHISKSLSSPLL